VRTATSGLDYLATWDDWLAVQNGAATVSRHAGTYRYIRTARDLAAYVQLDFSYQAFLTACLILFGMEGTTDVRRPYKGAPYDAANPYRGSKTQSGFSTFGVAHVLDLVARVANLALQHAWFHKWLVHRRLRPEEYGGRIHAHKTTAHRFPLHDSILASRVVEQVFERQRTYLLPQAYPEGSPIHPSYPSGHATIAGACVTVLKAFFDESFPIEEPVVIRPDGLGLAPYSGPTLTVGGELDKLAFNLGMGRNVAGIHWRGDNTEGLRLGEAIAIHVLRELRACHDEHFAGLSLTKFDSSRMIV
jgi:membrane-associated phospholipid phosphatase